MIEGFQYLLEFVDPAHFNLDTFHMRVIKEAASSLAASLAPVHTTLDALRNSVGERFGGQGGAPRGDAPSAGRVASRQIDENSGRRVDRQWAEDPAHGRRS